MPNRDSLAELLNGCSRGDQRAFEKLYERSAGQLYGICLSLLRREDVAEDALQDSFIRIWHRAGSYDPAKGTAMTWMTSIARNRALDLLRSARIQVERVSDEYEDTQFTSSEHSPAEAAELDASTKAVVECLEQLREQQRRCILMAYYHGHSHDELSELMSAPLGTVKAWIRRGLQRLRECLE